MKRLLNFENLELRRMLTAVTTVRLYNANGGNEANVYITPGFTPGTAGPDIRHSLIMQPFNGGKGCSFDAESGDLVTVIDHRTDPLGVVVPNDQPNLTIQQLKIDLGDGNNSLRLVGLNINETLSVVTDNDADDISIINCQIRWSMGIWSGNGDDTISLRETIINYDKKIGETGYIATGLSAQSGNDTVQITSSRIKSTTDGLSTFEIRLSGDNDTLIFRNDPASLLTCEGKFIVNGGENSGDNDKLTTIPNSQFFKIVYDNFETVNGNPVPGEVTP